MRSEAEVRRRVAEAIHDGPVQELIGLDMVLSTMGSELKRSNPERAEELLADARLIAARNIEVLRDEMVDLGPHGLDQVTLEAAIDTCTPVWKRRYAVDVEVDIDPVKLVPEVAGELFRIAQESASNAGRHSGGDRVAISLRRTADGVELTIADNGHGFGSFDPRSDSEPGHLGLASMRERAELLGGVLEIHSTDEGATIVARVPIGSPRERRGALSRLRAGRRRPREV
jgi:signal transduction histidine kinase